MCKETTAKYSYKDQTFCYKYELVKYMYSQGVTVRNIAAYLYNTHRVTERMEFAVRASLYYNRGAAAKPVINLVKTTKNTTSNIKKDNTSAVAGLTWSKVEYYSLMVGSTAIRVSPEIFSRLSVKDSVLTLE